MIRAPNPIACRSWKKIVERTVLVATTTLALVCLTVGVISYFQVVVFEPFDSGTRWCTTSIRRSRLIGTYSSTRTPPLSLIFSWDKEVEYNQLSVLRHKATGMIYFSEGQLDNTSPSSGIERIDDPDVAAYEIEQLAFVSQCWMNNQNVLRVDYQQRPFGFLFQVHLAIPFILFASYPIYRLTRFVQHRRQLKRIGKCVQCGYDLTGNVSGVCSECGHAINESHAA